MFIVTVVLGVIAAVLLAAGYCKGEGQHVTGLKSALSMTVSIFPPLVLAFIVAGMVQVLLLAEAISKWVGAESGFRGIFIGTVAGAMAPGGLFVKFASGCRTLSFWSGNLSRELR